MKTKHAFDMVHDAQEVFRILLEALANPGRVLSLRPYADKFAGQGRWLTPAVTLLDNGTGFFWDGDRETGEEIRFLTGAPPVPLEKADFVFLSAARGTEEKAGELAARVLSRVKQGTHLDPHDSALLFIAPGAGRAGENPDREFSLRGPGIPPEGRPVTLSPAEAAWRRARDERGFEYPCGVELVFLREDLSILALTRKTII
ncbi:MAG: phosphonate C-P lyase system protein PhnH, partial [Treponema sp.]|nr:phosphonate C-P lyase system protein PhnH [Treponema sp.]